MGAVTGCEEHRICTLFYPVGPDDAIWRERGKHGLSVKGSSGHGEELRTRVLVGSSSSLRELTFMFRYISTLASCDVASSLLLSLGVVRMPENAELCSASLRIAA